MSLGHLHIPTETVEWGSQSFAVRGISGADLSLLVVGYREKIDALIESYTQAAANAEQQFTGDDKEAQAAAFAVDGTLKGLLGESPQLAAQIIACAADDGNYVDTVLRMPLSVQLDALLKIFRLTFEEAGGVKKFLDDLISVLGLTGKLSAAIREPLTGMLN